jgi:circadian clock protein KaiC
MDDNRLKTGIEGLDTILEGGLVRGVSVLLEGPPGSGKTNLGLQILHNGMIRFEEPALVVSFEQFPEQIFRDALQFGWDLRELGQKGMFRMITTSPERMVAAIEGTVSDTERDIDIVFEEIAPKRLLIDSLTHFRRITTDESELREILIGFLHGLARRGCTTFLTREVEQEDGRISFEEYAVDASIRLTNLPLSGVGGNKRTLEVRKTRGQAHISGRHPMFFGPEGITVYPHLKPPPRPAPDLSRLSRPQVPSGVEGLDPLLHGGYVSGTTSLLAGSAGSGKTTVALHFLKAGFEAGEPGVLVTLNESPQQAAERFHQMGLDVTRLLEENGVTILSEIPVELCLERLQHDLARAIEETGAKRVVIDSVSDFETSVAEPELLRDYLFTFVKMFEDRGVTALLTSEIEQVTGANRVSELGYAFIIDTTLYLGFAEIESRMRRVISVLKMRSSGHESELRELLLTSEGPRVGAKFAGLQGIMGGIPSGQYQQTVEEVMQPLTFIRGFTDQLLTTELDPKKERRILEMMKEQTEKVMRFLCDFYGLDYDKMTGKRS